MSEVQGESGLEIDGERYPIPTLDTITLDEERLLYVYADVVVSDFIPVHPDWKPEQAEAHLLLQSTKIRNPEFKRALVHIAYKRRHPETADAEVQSLIGTASALGLDLELLRPRGAEDPPGALPERARQNERDVNAREEWGFWTTYREVVGDSGGEPRGYWDFRVGHVLPGITPDRVGELRPSDLLGALQRFEEMRARIAL